MIAEWMDDVWFWWTYERPRWRDNLAQWIAWRLPRRVAYWAYIRIHASATIGIYSDMTPDEVTVFMALKDWDRSG